MEPKFNTSFIPKKPVVETIASNTPKKSETMNIFSVGATVLFILTIFGYGGLYIYKNIVINQISQYDQQVNDARTAFQTSKIQELLDANSRIVAAKNILDKHLSVSELLLLLQQLTLKRFRISTLIFSSKDGSPTLSLGGEVQTYNALAEQSDVFSKSDFIKSPTFSDFSLTTNGNITVRLFLLINPNLVSYKNAIESLSTNQ